MKWIINERFSFLIRTKKRERERKKEFLFDKLYKRASYNCTVQGWQREKVKKPSWSGGSKGKRWQSRGRSSSLTIPSTIVTEIYPVTISAGIIIHQGWKLKYRGAVQSSFIIQSKPFSRRCVLENDTENSCRIELDKQIGRN